VFWKLYDGALVGKVTLAAQLERVPGSYNIHFGRKITHVSGHLLKIDGWESRHDIHVDVRKFEYVLVDVEQF
jgi:hypothetical protein